MSVGDVMKNSEGWKEFKRIRLQYVLSMFTLPVILIPAYDVFPSDAALIIFSLSIVALLYFVFLRRLFKVLCPVCGESFFPKGGGIIFFVRCHSCGAKIGDDSNQNS